MVIPNRGQDNRTRSLHATGNTGYSVARTGGGSMLTIFIVSDAAGETAERMVRSAALLYAIEMNRLILYNFLAIPVQRVSG
jgi:hypothetical protein